MYMHSFERFPSQLGFSSRLSIRKSVRRFRTMRLQGSPCRFSQGISTIGAHMDSVKNHRTTPQKKKNVLFLKRICPKTKKQLVNFICIFGRGKGVSGVFKTNPPPKRFPDQPASTRTATQMLKGRPPSSASFTLNHENCWLGNRPNCGCCEA